jgi:hypothetical protein
MDSEVSEPESSEDLEGVQEKVIQVMGGDRLMISVKNLRMLKRKKV